MQWSIENEYANCYSQRNIVHQNYFFTCFALTLEWEQTMGEYLTLIFITALYLAELSGKVVILCLHTLERACQCRLI